MKIMVAMLIILALATVSRADQWSDMQDKRHQDNVESTLENIENKLDNLKNRSDAPASTYVDPALLPKRHSPYDSKDPGFGEVDQKALKEMLDRPVPPYVPPKKGKR